jgi:hypothetical protein
MIVRAIRRCAEAIAAEGGGVLKQIEAKQAAFEILNLTGQLERALSPQNRSVTHALAPRCNACDCDLWLKTSTHKDGDWRVCYTCPSCKKEL